jgi:hypothetical protein
LLPQPQSNRIHFLILFVPAISPRWNDSGEAGRGGELARRGSLRLLYEAVQYRKSEGSMTCMQLRPSGVEQAGTTDTEGEIVVGLDKGKYIPDYRALLVNGKPTWKRVSDQLDCDGVEHRFRECPRGRTELRD